MEALTCQDESADVFCYRLSPLVEPGFDPQNISPEERC